MKHIRKAIELGVIENNENIEDLITREGFVEIIVKTYEMLTQEELDYSNIFFEDTNNKYVLKAREVGFIKGVNEKEFRPNNFLTIEESIVITDRMVSSLNLKENNLNKKKKESGFLDKREISDWAKQSVLDFESLEILNVEDKLLNPKKVATQREVVTTLMKVVDKFYPEEDVVIDIVKFPKDKDLIFPSHWYDGEIRGRFKEVNENRRSKLEDIINEELEKYPKEVILKNLENIYILKNLSFYGYDYGGTYAFKDIYLSSGLNDLNYDNDSIRRSFHHEFSSILLNNYRRYFNSNEWMKVNAEYNYYGSGIGALKSGLTSLDLSSYYFQKGFLTQYSTASMEEDFNVFAENMFMGKERFWYAVDNYEKINEKYKIMIEFFSSINPKLNDDYFRNLNLYYKY